jgi:hypothetical protein
MPNHVQQSVVATHVVSCPEESSVIPALNASNASLSAAGHDCATTTAIFCIEIIRTKPKTKTNENFPMTIMKLFSALTAAFLYI